ncbi:MAG: PKD domain-containing protein, partial [Chloroflexota bacterium]|nr:PKD domain-containing protein [Chloroflexota bacterium]
TPKPTPTPSATPTPAPEVPAEPTPELTPVNLAPSADAGGPYKVDEGDSVKLDGTASRDPDGKIVGYEWSRQKRLDDPTRKRPLFEAIDDAVLEIDLTVTDDRGASDTASARIKVRNVDPRITGLEPLRVLVGEEVELAFVIRDPGPDEHEFSIDWGDGTVGASRLHVYETGGDYQVVINVVDDDGGSGSAESTVTVSEVAEIAGSSPQMGSAATDE